MCCLLLIAVVASSIEDGSLAEGLLLESVCSSKIPEESVRVIFAGLTYIARTALRQPNLKPEVYCTYTCFTTTVTINSTVL